MALKQNKKFSQHTKSSAGLLREQWVERNHDGNGLTALWTQPEVGDGASECRGPGLCAVCTQPPYHLLPSPAPHEAEE